MKKQFLAAAMALTLALCATGCGDNTSTNPPSASAAAGASASVQSSAVDTDKSANSSGEASKDNAEQKDEATVSTEPVQQEPQKEDNNSASNTDKSTSDGSDKKASSDKSASKDSDSSKKNSSSTSKNDNSSSTDKKDNSSDSGKKDNVPDSAKKDDTSAPTDTNKGDVSKDDGKSDITTPEHTHSYTGVVTKAATCTEAGEKTYTCSCGESYTEAIPAAGHSYTVADSKAATCTEDGEIALCPTVENQPGVHHIPRIAVGIDDMQQYILLGFFTAGANRKCNPAQLVHIPAAVAGINAGQRCNICRSERLNIVLAAQRVSTQNIRRSVDVRSELHDATNQIMVARSQAAKTIWILCAYTTHNATKVIQAVIRLRIEPLQMLAFMFHNVSLVIPPLNFSITHRKEQFVSILFVACDASGHNHVGPEIVKRLVIQRQQRPRIPPPHTFVPVSP